MVERADPETSISEVARCNGVNCQSAFKFGSDSLLMQFERCLALWLGENQRKRAFYCTGCARGWPRRGVTPGPSGIIGTAWLT
ncbi:hypothetical protein NLN62_23450 [Bradyrhizobium sp. CCGUVB23]|nr:hypothetical protein [Bradyrhizobium sp. CCGUVB23]